MATHRKITAARTALVLEQPFFGVLALGLKMKEDAGCGTAWTDGRNLGYDPAFIDPLSIEECKALLVHEVMHCAMGHPWRRDGRNMKAWNVACDAAINPEIRDAGFKLPADGVFAQGDEIGKSAEWIYSRRFRESPDGQPKGGKGKGTGTAPGPHQTKPDPNSPPDSQDGQGGASGSKPDPLGEVRDAPDGPDADGDAPPTEQDWKQRTAAAANQARMQGKLSAGMERAIGQALKPKIDKRSLLHRFFSERAQSDYSWARPNARYIAQGLYLPALDSRDLGEIAVLIDTSGSTTGPGLDRAQGELASIIEECAPAGVTVYYVDAAVKRVEHFAKGEPLTWKPIGGGGTDFRGFFAAVESDENAPVCIVGISDMQAYFPSEVPTIPVLWLSTEEHGTAPFGEVVYVDY